MASLEPDSVATVPSQVLNNMLQELMQPARSSQTSPIAKPPRLESSKSAPPPDTDTGVSESTPSQNRFATLVRAQSLGFGGDTQELTSQELRESMRHSMTTPHTLQRTQKDGDNAFINLESEWDVPSQQVFEEEFLHETQTPAVVPMTPAAGREGDRDTGIFTSVAKTPHYSQFFGGAAPMMTASQLINQTQQPSSPPPNDFFHSDPIDQRPSPGAERSSPSLIWFHNSSPDLGRGVRPSTAPGEPRAVYRSMQESQALRARKAFPMPNEADGEEDDLDEESYNTRKRRIRRTLSENALRVKAPARPGSRRTLNKSSGRSNVLDLTTPAPARRQRVQFEDVDSPDVEEEAELLEHEHGEQNEEAEDAEEPLHDEDYVSTPLGSIQEDVYDEFSQNIVGQTNETEMDDASTVASVEQNDDGMKTTTAQEHQHVGQSTQRSTIADSQPDGQQASHATIIRHIQHSSNASFVPGSQHAGKTSEDQAWLAPSSQRRSQMRVAASQVDREDSSKIPSSPPLLRVSSTLPDASDTTPDELAGDSSLAPRDPIEESKSSTAPCEIPESELAETENYTVNVRQGSTVTEKSNMPNAAREMETDTVDNKHADEESQDAARDTAPYSTARIHVSGSLQSPRKPSQSQRSYMTDPSPRKLAGVRRFADFDTNGLSTNGSFDLEADVDDVMQGVITEEDQQVWDRTNDLPDQARMNKRRKLDTQGSSRTISTNSNQTRHGTGGPSAAIDASEEDVHEQGNGNIARPQSPPTALRDSPNKANEMLTPATKGTSKAVLDDFVSESVVQREKAGSDAVSQLVRNRGTAKKTKQHTYGRASRRAPSNIGVASKKTTFVPESNQAVPDQEPEAIPTTSTDDRATDEATETVVEDGSTEKILSPEPNPNRVFALFKGHPPAYYPATWIASHDIAMSKVRFDDGTETTIETQQVMRLDLRVDDTIKVNVPGLRNKTWRVAGFGAVEGGKVTDANGQTRAKIQAKGGRDSLSKGSSEAADDGDREVLVEHVYLTSTMWPSFKDRMFSPPSRATISRAETPLAQLTAKSRGSLRGDTPASSSRSSHGIFSGMAFAVSYIHHEAEKAGVTRLISRHGGMILDGGFEELFELPNIGEAQLQSPKKSPRKQAQSGEAAPGLRLKAEYKDLGFVALIADKHSRRAKYMQALALGLPTLSGRWVVDSLDSSKNSSVEPLAWDRYLLPAGESAYLGGAIRSRTLPSYAIPTATLGATISARTTLLNGESVLIVAPKKDKAGWEKRRTYAFLTLALGAGRVKRVFDLEEAKALIQEDPQESKWLYVDGSVAKAKSILFDKSKGGKRKRGGDVATANSKVRIVDDEFVVQSLILGALYE